MGSAQSHDGIENEFLQTFQSGTCSSDNVVEKIFSFPINHTNEIKLKNIFAQQYQLNPNFFVSILHEAIDHIIKITSNDLTPNIKQPIQTSVAYIKFLLLSLVKEGKLKHVLDEKYSEEQNYGLATIKSLNKVLFLRHCTNRSDEAFWGFSSRDDSKFDWLRLNIVESLMILSYYGYTHDELPVDKLLKSAVNTMRYTRIPNLRSKIKSIECRFQLIQCMLTYLLLSGHPLSQLRIQAGESQLIFEPIYSDLYKKSNEEVEPYMPALLLHLIAFLEKNRSAIDPSDIQLIINIIRFIDKTENSTELNIALYALSYVVSFPSTGIALNEPCTAVISSKPIHRGSFADVLIEVCGRCGLKEGGPLVEAAYAISACIPYAANLSYSSAVGVFNVVSAAARSGRTSAVSALIKAIHFAINRSVRESAALVIIAIKSARIVFAISRALPTLEEAAELSTFIRNVNAELRQIGKSVRAKELEVFLSDPACEHFANPVLHPPPLLWKVLRVLRSQSDALTELYLSKREGITLTKEKIKDVSTDGLLAAAVATESDSN